MRETVMFNAVTQRQHSLCQSPVYDWPFPLYSHRLGYKQMTYQEMNACVKVTI